MGTLALDDTQELDRFRGCILGLAIGDALGHPTEFVDSVAEIRARWGAAGITGFESAREHPPGTFTDDTQMSIAAARALIRAGHAGLEPMMSVLGVEFVAWARSPKNNRAPGMACMTGCDALARGADWRSAGAPRSKGCGAAMRAAPFGLYFAGRPQLLLRVAAAQSVLTHRHPTGIASSVAAAAAVSFVVEGGHPGGLIPAVRAAVAGVDEALLIDVGCDPARARATGAREMLAALDHLEGTLDEESDDVCSLAGDAWVGEEAVAAALWCVLRARGDFRGAVLRGANSSGDSDSIACIAGAIAGAAAGIAGIDGAWIRGVEQSDFLDRLARALHGAKHGQDRPSTGETLDLFGAELAPRPG
jgi:ADP-ribosylglycohydrolase